MLHFMGHIVTTGLKFVAVTLLAFGWDKVSDYIIASLVLALITLVLHIIALIIDCAPEFRTTIPAVINLGLVGIPVLLTVPNIVMVGILAFNPDKGGYDPCHAAGFTYELFGFFSGIALTILIYYDWFHNIRRSSEKT